MCLITNKPPRVLEENMTVYKELKILRTQEGPVYTSPFYNFTWIRNEMKESKLEIENTVLDESIQTFDIDARKGFLVGEFIIAIYEGFHAALYPQRFHNPAAIGTFLIPKRATVYEDNSGLIVSNKMMFIQLFNLY